jgi:hypothetical protein
MYTALKDDTLWGNHGTLYYYTSLLENGQRDPKLISQMSDYVEIISSLYGSMSQSTMRGLYAYMMSTINPVQSLEFLNNEINKYRKFRISSTFSLGEFLRLKGKKTKFSNLTFEAKVLMDTNENLREVREEVEQALLEARENAVLDNWKNTEMKILTELVTFYERLGDCVSARKYAKELSNVLHVIEMHSKSNPPSSVYLAQQIVNKL